MFCVVHMRRKSKALRRVRKNIKLTERSRADSSVNVLYLEKPISVASWRSLAWTAVAFTCAELVLARAHDLVTSQFVRAAGTDYLYSCSSPHNFTHETISLYL
jgi:hypothetical protein